MGATIPAGSIHHNGVSPMTSAIIRWPPLGRQVHPGSPSHPITDETSSAQPELRGCPLSSGVAHRDLGLPPEILSGQPPTRGGNPQPRQATSPYSTPAQTDQHRLTTTAGRQNVSSSEFWTAAVRPGAWWYCQ